jgi:hypothetical protein
MLEERGRDIRGDRGILEEKEERARDGRGRGEREGY